MCPCPQGKYCQQFRTQQISKEGMKVNNQNLILERKKGTFFNTRIHGSRTTQGRNLLLKWL